MPEDFDTGFTLIPGDDEVSVDDQLAAALNETGLSTTEEPRKPFGRGWAFDFGTGQFIAHGSSPAVVYDTDNLRIWIEKTLRTARLAHVIYSDEYGMEEPVGAVGQLFTPALAGLMAMHITEALTVHDRITEVRDFQFTGGPASSVLYVNFTVVTDNEHLPLKNIPIARTPA